MSNEDTNLIDRDIRELNMLYLQTLKSVAKISTQEAVIRFGIDTEVVEMVRDASVEKIRSMSSSSILNFSPRCARGKFRHIIEGDDACKAGMMINCIASEAAENSESGSEGKV